MFGANLYAEIARRLREARDRARFTTAQMAERMGVPSATYTQWEWAEVPIKSDHLRRAAEILGVQMSYFLEGDTPWPNGVYGLRFDNRCHDWAELSTAERETILRVLDIANEDYQRRLAGDRRPARSAVQHGGRSRRRISL